MFHYDAGLKLTRADLAIDVRRRQPRAFVSHAHFDHMARHELALCTPQTSLLYQLRLGRRPTLPMPYRKTIDWGGLRLTTYPAGHCLGSAMLLAQEDDRTLLYTGDFKLGASETAEPADLPRADILVMECTYGRPRYRFASRDQAIDQLLTLIGDLLRAGQTPVIHAYVMGKAQEVSRILTRAGFPVLQHPEIAKISEVYRACDVDLGDCRPYPGHYLPGHVVVVPPRQARQFRLAGLPRPASIAVTGWANDESTKWRLGVDHAVPLSDHAGFDELIEAAGRVGASEVLCTHGTDEFVGHLRDAGFNARALQPAPQRRLF